MELPTAQEKSKQLFLVQLKAHQPFDHDENTAKIKILKIELSVTICTVDTIGTIKSQKSLKNWYFVKSRLF
jgi:hypothetical protein